ncbi:MAG: hypothetical protein KBE09_02195 [Candidatus Pacebacteria bacterium]|nr:hypothetical protein [Candidatus Paceibacterota bacterium]
MLSVRRTTVSLVALVVCVGALCVLSGYHRSLARVLQSPGTIQTMISCAYGASELRGECYEAQIPKLLGTFSAEHVFEMVRRIQRVDHALSDCHILAHRIGEWEVATDPDNWIDFIGHQPFDGLCAFGYVHGVIEGKFRLEEDGVYDVDQLIPRLRLMCERDPATGEVRSLVGRRVCYHGLGHAFYYIEQGDVEKGMALCERTVIQKADSAYTQCLNGVAMPRFAIFLPPDLGGVDKASISKEDATSFCRSLKTPAHRNACHRASWTLFWEDIRDTDGIDKLCANQEPDRARSDCYGKVFVGVAWKLRYDREEYIRVCHLVEPDMRAMCFAADALERISNGGVTPQSVKYAIQLCRDAGYDAPLCTKILALSSVNYSKTETQDRWNYCSLFNADLEPACLLSVSAIVEE